MELKLTFCKVSVMEEKTGKIKVTAQGVDGVKERKINTVRLNVFREKKGKLLGIVMVVEGQM